MSVKLMIFIVVIAPLVGEWMLVGNVAIANLFSGIFSALITMTNGTIYQLTNEVVMPFYIGISLIAIL